MFARPLEAPIYHPVLKHSRFAAKLRAGRYIGASKGRAMPTCSQPFMALNQNRMLYLKAVSNK